MNTKQAWDYLNQFEPKPRLDVEKSLPRYLKTIEWLPKGPAKVLDLGSNNYFILLLSHLRPEYEIQPSGVEKPRGAYAESSFMSHIQHQSAKILPDSFFNAEKDAFPFPDESFDLVLCLELIEHLLSDPMHMVFEIGRVLKSGGKLLLTTPNIMSWRAALNIIVGRHPMEYLYYLKDLGFSQHIREYLPWELKLILEQSGFKVLRLKTYEVTDTRKLSFYERMLTLIFYPLVVLKMRHPKFLFHRNPKIFIMGEKIGLPEKDAGGFLYGNLKEDFFRD